MPKKKSLDEQIRECVAVIYAGEEECLVQGTAFLIPNNENQLYVLTAFHVVVREEHYEKFLEEDIHLISNNEIDFLTPIKLTFKKFNIQCNAEIVENCYSFHDDWILLKIKEDGINNTNLQYLKSIKPLPLGKLIQSDENRNWKTFGFPTFLGNVTLLKEEDNFFVGGDIRSVGQTYQLFCNELATDNDISATGYSGAPCIVNGVVVGLLRKEPVIINKEKIITIGTIFACPINLIKERCQINIPDIKKLSEIIDPVTYSDFINNWTSWSADKLELYDGSGLFSRNVQVTSPLEQDWQSFIKAPHWRTKLFNILELYKESIRNNTIFKGMPSEPPVINGSYETVRNSLEIWIKNVKKKLNSLESSANNSKQTDRQILNDIYSMKRQMLSFIEQISDEYKARLGIGFFIFGAQGYGKTQFLRNRQLNVNYHNDKSDSHEFLPLFLPIDLEHWSEDISFENHILRHIKEASKRNDWQSIVDFDSFISAFNLRLVIIIDDFDRKPPKINNQVRDLMAVYTKLDSIFYLFTMSDTSLDIVANSESKFWKLLSYDFNHAICMAGWINLADFNRKEKVGIKILKAANKNKEAKLLDKYGEILILESPLVAQIVLGLMREKNIHTIISLNFIDFLNAFWEKFQLNKENNSEIKQLISCIVSAVFEKSSIKPYLKDIQNCLTNKHLFTSEDSSPIKNLKDKSLLRIINPESQDIIDDEPDKYIQLNYQFFWNAFLAKQVWNDFNPLSDNQHEVLKVVINDKTVQEGIWEYVLLLADKSKDKNLEPEQVHKIWLTSFDNPNLVCTPFFAARWASKDIQKTIASTLIKDKKSIALVNREVLFSLMLFAIETPELEPQTRFKLLRPYYRDIYVMSLTDYFEYGAEKILKGLKKLKKSKILNPHDTYHSYYECLSELADSHLTGSAPIIASIAWEIFVYLHGKNIEYNLKTLISCYLLYEKENAEKEHQNLNEPKDTRTLFFREEFIAESFYWLWQQNISPVELFYLLNKIDWYNSTNKHKISSTIAKEMKNGANRAFGKHFQWLLKRYRYEYINEYKALIYDLLIGTLIVKGVEHSEEIGYFILRHSGRTSKRKLGSIMYINSILWDELELASRITVLQENLIQFPIEKDLL